MSGQLYNELVNLGHTEVTDLDLEYPPESVVIYLKNGQETDKRVVIEFLDPLIQLQLENQNPTLIIEESGQSTICLSSSEMKDCSDATSEIVIEGDVDYGTKENMREWMVYVDEDYLGTTTCWQEESIYVEDLINGDGRLSADYVGNPEYSYLKIMNRSSIDGYVLRLTPTVFPTEESRDLIDTSNNPTYNYDRGTGTVTACLSTTDLISCEGALEGIYFNNLVDDFDLEINGELVPEYQNMSSYIRQNLNDILECNNDGFFDLINISNNFIRIVMSGQNMIDSILNEDADNTPIHISEDGSIYSFCLAPQQPR